MVCGKQRNIDLTKQGKTMRDLIRPNIVRSVGLYVSKLVLSTALNTNMH